MATTDPTLTWLIVWGQTAAAVNPTGLQGNAYKQLILAAAEAWYAINLPLRYPNTANAMLYAYLDSLYP